ncbi:FAD binding domain protein [Thozetella sp. PMI_491]|nr:FAD binding domain protein [Thozetella sp. PMI_491]
MDKSFRVLIAGGGVAGLTLANMLERFDIDYLILEAHGDIAPPVGASIGLFPNGLRILDQIDCYEPILKFSINSVHDGTLRNRNGKAVSHTPLFQKQLEVRHGYPLLFFDRQWLLQALYEKLKHKDRVLLNHRIDRIELFDGGVEVDTADGQKLYGSIIIGADGVHSAVRQEMYRIGEMLEPGYFPSDEQDRVLCDYLCSFGIAQDVPGWVNGTQCQVTGRGTSQLVVSGPEKRVYWFFFSKLEETKFGKEIPRVTKEMEAEFIKKYAQTPVTDRLTFGQIYAHRLTSTLTPLHEFVCKKWFFNRMLIFGDSAHKPNPIGGQGGNGAIESAAELVNALLRKRDSRSGSLVGLSDQDIKDVFTEMETARHKRAEMIVSAAHMQQALMAYENPIVSTVLFDVLSPFMGLEPSMSRMAQTMTGGTRLEQLPIRHRPRAIPFADELPASRLDKVALAVRILFAALMVFLLYIAIKPLHHSISAPGLLKNTGSLGFDTSDNIGLKGFINQHVSTFSILGKTTEQAAGILYFSSQLLAPILIYTLEGYRSGNEGSVLGLPGLFLMAACFVGFGRLAPIYSILSAFFAHELPTGRFVEPEAAISLAPALTLGYVLPTVLMALPTPNLTSWKTWAIMSQFSPLLVCVLTYGLSSILRLWKQSGKSEEEKRQASLDRYKGQDVPIIKSTYTYAFILQATAHLALLIYAYQHPDISVVRMLFGLVEPSRLGQYISGTGSHLAFTYKHDMVIAAGSWLLSNLYAVWDLRRLGYIKTRDMLFPMLGVVLGQAVVGPGATWTALWYWRENVIANLKLE